MTGSVDRKKEIRLWSHIFYAVFFSAFILCCAIIQCSDIKLFGVLPEVTFGTVCAIGFVAKEKYGEWLDDNRRVIGTNIWFDDCWRIHTD
jgi:hypothetical protein